MCCFGFHALPRNDHSWKSRDYLLLWEFTSSLGYSLGSDLRPWGYLEFICVLTRHSSVKWICSGKAMYSTYLQNMTSRKRIRVSCMLDSRCRTDAVLPTTKYVHTRCTEWGQILYKGKSKFHSTLQCPETDSKSLALRRDSTSLKNSELCISCT